MCARAGVWVRVHMGTQARAQRGVRVWVCTGVGNKKDVCVGRCRYA